MAIGFLTMNFLNKNWVIIKFIKKIAKRSFYISVSIESLFLAILPEKIFIEYCLVKFNTDISTIIINRCITFLMLYILIFIIVWSYKELVKKVDIKGFNYHIVVEYGDIFKIKNTKKVIAFDECFTLKIGVDPADIKPDSVCGQYLKQYPLEYVELENLLKKYDLRPARSKSKYKNQIRYESGKIIPRGDFYLIPFAKLNSDGAGVLTREELLDCLNLLWEEINKFYDRDVCITILGSGRTRFKDTILDKQYLLDMIIASYKLTPYKIKLPYKLHIVCRKSDDLSLNKIGEYM